MKRTTTALLLIIAAVALGGYAWMELQKPSGGRSITVYCAAGLKKPIEVLAADFQKETGTEVSLQYGGTGTLLSQIRVAKQGDLFIAADEGSLADARKLDVVKEALPVAVQHLVIAVAKGNPKGIRTLDDLMKNEVRFALPNPEAASAGKIAKSLLGERWATFAAKAAVMKPTVTEVAADVTLGAVDAAVVWDSTVPQFKQTEAVVIAVGTNETK